MTGRWLLVGALGVETAPLLELLERPRPVSRRLVVGRLRGREVGVLTCGVGPTKAWERTAAGLRDWRPDRVLNLGTCGALTEAHDIGSIVHVGEVLVEGEGLSGGGLSGGGLSGGGLSGGGLSGGGLLPLGTPAVALVTVQAGVWDPVTRDALAARGAAVCEMEAAGVLAACRTAGVPLHAAKVVSDRAGGEPDPAIPASRRAAARPGPVDVAVFKARALRLCRRHLAPLVPAMLDGV